MLKNLTTDSMDTLQQINEKIEKAIGDYNFHSRKLAHPHYTKQLESNNAKFLTPENQRLFFKKKEIIKLHVERLKILKENN